MAPLFVLSFSYLLKKLGFPKPKLSGESFQKDQNLIIHLITSAILGAGIVLLIVQITTAAQKPLILPYIYGFQIAFASLSQDAARFILSLLFGSGYGTFQTDFTRFRLPSFNLEQNLWNLNFSYSSSYVLELIATVGLAGIISYLFILIKTLKTRTNNKNPIFSAVIATFILSFLLHLLIDQYLDFQQLGTISHWLKNIEIKLDRDKTVFYWAAAGLALILYGFIL